MEAAIDAGTHALGTVPNPAKCDILTMDTYAESIAMLRERHKCPYFRILIIGRANAGKTTILENICGVAHGTQPIIYDEHGVKLKANIKPKPEPNPKPRFKLPIKFLNRNPVSSAQYLMPSMEVSCRLNSTYGSLLIDVQPISEGGS